MLNGRRMLAGQLVVVTARSDMGKSAFALSAAKYMATHHSASVAYFSLEMNRKELAKRALCSESGISSEYLGGQVSEDDLGDLATVIGRLSNKGLHLNDNTSLTMAALRAEARRMVSQHSARALVVDYLQLMEGDQRVNRTQEVTVLARGA